MIKLPLFFLILLVSLVNPFKTIHTVVLTEDGFKPERLVVNPGDSVIFKTDLNKPFWPASDSHPTHTIYSEFDPKKQIDPDSSWKFTFNKEGRWNFHDHLSPLNVGAIIVRPDGYAGELETSIENCKKAHSADCWSELLKRTAGEKGVSEAFNVFTEAFNTDSTFAENCHDYTHILGQEAYLNFYKNKDFPVTDQLAYCSYGFFHGFIEAMVQKEGNLLRARNMCDYIDKRLAEKTSTIGACLHGIGHGVTDGSDASAYGDPSKLTAPGLKLCESIAKDEYEDKICATGVFNALAIMYVKGKFGLTPDEKDPYAICRAQSRSAYKHACYDDFKILILKIKNNNFIEAAKYIEEIEDDKMAQGAIDNLATYYVYSLLKEPAYEKPIKECYQLSLRLHKDCIAGLGAGFMIAGTPGTEYKRALELCSNPMLKTPDMEGCYDRVIRLIKLRYNKGKYVDICKTVPAEFQNYCDFYLKAKE